MTVAVMEAFGVTVERPDGSTWVVEPQTYRATTYAIEPDASAASYFFAAAAVVGGRVTVDGLGTPSLQGDLDFVDLLGEMGARVERATAPRRSRPPPPSRRRSNFRRCTPNTATHHTARPPPQP